jgi:hypothetical protein
VAFFYAVSKPMNHEASARKTIQEAKRATDPSAQMEGPALSGPPSNGGTGSVRSAKQWRDRLCPVRRCVMEGPALSGPPMRNGGTGSVRSAVGNGGTGSVRSADAMEGPALSGPLA